MTAIQTCPDCGQAVEPGAEICPHCQLELPASTTASGEPERTAKTRHPSRRRGPLRRLRRWWERRRRRAN